MKWKSLHTFVEHWVNTKLSSGYKDKQLIVQWVFKQVEQWNRPSNNLSYELMRLYNLTFTNTHLQRIHNLMLYDKLLKDGKFPNKTCVWVKITASNRLHLIALVCCKANTSFQAGRCVKQIYRTATSKQLIKFTS